MSQPVIFMNESKKEINLWNLKKNHLPQHLFGASTWLLFDSFRFSYQVYLVKKTLKSKPEALEEHWLPLKWRIHKKYWIHQTVLSEDYVYQQQELSKCYWPHKSQDDNVTKIILILYEHMYRAAVVCRVVVCLFTHMVYQLLRINREWKVVDSSLFHNYKLSPEWKRFTKFTLRSDKIILACLQQ